MNLASVFALPSHREPFGLVLLEALACGLRVVSTDQGGPPAFVPTALRHSRDAILVPGLSESSPPVEKAAGFVTQLSGAISEQIDKTLSLADRRRISRTVHDLSWGRYVDALVTLYDQLRRAGRVQDANS
jgi:glycosyltransferase involved in cell wall biosynthesis